MPQIHLHLSDPQLPRRRSPRRPRCRRRTAAAPRSVVELRRRTSRHRPGPAGSSISSTAPSSVVPARDQLEAERAPRPARSRTAARPPAAPGGRGRRRACSAIWSTTLWVIDSSCTVSRSGAAGRRPAGPRSGSRRTTSRSSTSPGGSSATVPIIAAPSPSGCARSAASAASAGSGATTATSRPSQATYSGSMPSSSDAPLTTGRTGTAFSSSTTATPDAVATSLQIVATPPRVASRRQPHAVAGGVEQAGGDAVQRRGVGVDVGDDVQLAAGEHHGDAVVADRPGHQHHVAGLRRGRGQHERRRSSAPTPAVVM